MRSWLLSNTFYGTWLPGDERGSVTSVRDARPDDPESAFRSDRSQQSPAICIHIVTFPK